MKTTTPTSPEGEGPKAYTFRELNGEAELETFLKLRYETYVNSRSLRHFLTENEARIDMDVYDLHAKHFGLFQGVEPAGYIRVVAHKSQCYNPDVFAIGVRNQIFQSYIHREKELTKHPYPDFPFLSYDQIPQEVCKYYSSLSMQEKESAIEGGRFMLFNNELVS